MGECDRDRGPCGCGDRATYNSGCVVTDQQSGSSTAPTDSPYFYKSW